MKSVYIVSPNYPPDICGIGDYSAFLSKNLLEKNIDTHVVTFTETNHPNERVHTIKNADKKSISSWLRCLGNPKNIDVIFIQYEPYSFSKKGIPLYLVYIFFMLKIKGFKIAIMFHEVATRLYIANFKKIMVSLVQLFIGYFLTAISSIRITSTSFNAKQLRPFKFTLVPIPSNFNRNAPGTNHNNTVQSVGCFANRIDDFFASVIDEILQKKIGVVYVMGKQSEKYNEVWKKHNFYKRENLIITGTLSSNGIEECFNKLDIFIHMEKVDTHGRGGASLKNGSLAAALNWGLPVVTAKGDMTDENMLKDQENILFVKDPFNVNDWVKSVQCLQQKEDFRSNIQKNAAAFYEETLSWPTVTTKYISLINNFNSQH